MNIRELEGYIPDVLREIIYIDYDKRLEIFLFKLEVKLKKAELRKLKLENIEEISIFENKKDDLEREIEEQTRKKQNEKRYKKEEILRRFTANVKRVILRDKITNDERKILLENGFTQINEFCLYEKKRIPVLIDPISNHSKTHEFLVWSAIKLLRTINGITGIKEHFTRDADITFEYKSKTFALEIETGSLLRKPEQLNEKISYLNKKYPNKWMIIVSNRNDVAKYKKFGMASSRIKTQENLTKLLKNVHT